MAMYIIHNGIILINGHFKTKNELLVLFKRLKQGMHVQTVGRE